MEGKKQEDCKDDCNNGPRNVDMMISLDLTIEILTRLPVKSHLKFQYVSKTWCSIIRSKDFINSSVSMSSTPSSRLLISFRNDQLIDNNAKKCLFIFSASQEQDHESSPLIPNLDMRMTSMDAYFNIRGASVNGFVCLSHKGRFMICNPSTRQVVTLPELTGTDWYFTHKYLGYDPVKDQYKAMCKRISIFEEEQEHMVLTFGSDKKPSWRRIEGTTRDYCPRTKGICINGFVYYGAWTETGTVVVCFDVRSERLSFIKLPSLIIIHWEDTKYLINYKGKLAYVHVSSGDRLIRLDLRVLQDAREHQWSEKTCWFHSSLGKIPLSIHGTNKIDEIIITPKFLPSGLQPFNIIYYM